MGQDVNLAWKITVWNVGCIFAYFCGGHKSNFTLWFRISIKENKEVLLPNKTMKYFNLNRPLDPLILRYSKGAGETRSEELLVSYRKPHKPVT